MKRVGWSHGAAVALLCVSGGLLGCVGMLEAARPLTPEARAVMLVPSGQSWSVALAEKCERHGRIDKVMSEHFARLRAAEEGASVAQVLAEQRYNGSVHHLDVRYWRCSTAVREQLASLSND